MKVSDSGKMNSVLTVYEIQQGEETAKLGNSTYQLKYILEFHGLDTHILLKALQSLEAQSKAKIFTGNADGSIFPNFSTI